MKRTDEDAFQHFNLNDFFENALSGFAIADPQGQLIKVNKTLLSWLGCRQKK